MICAITRPRYQVSVYRTIGPLVCKLHVDTDITYTADDMHNNKGIHVAS